MYSFSVLTKNRCVIIAFILILFFILPVSFSLEQGMVLNVSYADFGDFLLDLASPLGSAVDATIGNVFEFITVIFEKIAGIFLWMGTGLFDVSVELSLNSSVFKMDAVEVAWSLLRDFANMLFIFVILYIAVMTIFRGSGFGTNKLLSSLIIAALLINFSFFITGFVIDTGNITGLTIYSSLTDCRAGSPSCGSDGKRKLSDVFGDGMKIETLFQGFESIESNFAKGLARIFNAIAMLVAATIFLSGALLFIARTVILIFLLILSPLAFAAMILPKTSSRWNEWVGKLFNYSFVAPLYLLLIAVVAVLIHSGELSVLLNPNNAPLGAVGGNLGSGFADAALIKILLGFAIVVGLLHGALVVAKNMADGAQSWATKYSGKITGRGIGGAGYIGRRFGGALGRKVAESEWLGKRLQSDSGFQRFIGTSVARGAKTAREGNWDLRSAPGVGSVTKQLDVDLGKAGGKGGDEVALKREIEKKAEVAKIVADSGSGIKDLKGEVSEREEKLRVAKRTGVESLIATETAELKKAKDKLERLKESQREAYISDVINAHPIITGRARPTMRHVADEARKKAAGKSGWEKITEDMKKEAEKTGGAGAGGAGAGGAGAGGAGAGGAGAGGAGAGGAGAGGAGAGGAGAGGAGAGGAGAGGAP